MMPVLTATEYAEATLKAQEVTRDIVAEARSYVLVDTGWMTKQERAALDAAARRGEIQKWRGHWHPVPGADFGIGPLKTCYGVR